MKINSIIDHIKPTRSNYLYIHEFVEKLLHYHFDKNLIVRTARNVL